MWNTIIRYAAAILALAAAQAAWAHDPHARYIGNEGVMVVRGETKILFDAFYADSYGRFYVPPPEVYADMNAGRPPYDGVDAIFFSHVHGDHFSPAPTIAYLRAQPDVRVFGPAQIIDALREAGADAALLARIEAFDIAPQEAPRALAFDGLSIDVVAVPHVGGARQAAIRNLVFRVAIDDATTVMHLGDADAVAANFTPHQAHWDARELNMAFTPYWFFSNGDGRSILADILKAEQAVGIHAPAEAAGDGAAWREQYGADLFTDPGETRRIGPAAQSPEE